MAMIVLMSLIVMLRELLPMVFRILHPYITIHSVE